MEVDAHLEAQHQNQMLRSYLEQHQQYFVQVQQEAEALAARYAEVCTANQILTQSLSESQAQCHQLGAAATAEMIKLQQQLATESDFVTSLVAVADEQRASNKLLKRENQTLVQQVSE